MKKKTFIFAGTSEFALDCLKVLMQTEFLSLQGILSRPDTLQGRGLKKQGSLVKAFAEKNKIPFWTPKTANEKDFLQNIIQKKCDFSFICAYGQILPTSYLNLFPKGCLNLHLSLLPRWRGAAPVQRALMAGDQETGVSLQLMVEELDAGDIIGKRSFKIEQNANAKDLFIQSLKETKSVLKEELIKYLNGELKAQAQDSSKKTYARKIDKKECQLIWEESSLKIHNKIRALFLGPQAFSFFKEQRIKFHQACPLNESFSSFSPGEVCKIEKDKLFVACGKGSLSLLEIQKEGRKKQKIRDFLRGTPIQLKDVFK